MFCSLWWGDAQHQGLGRWINGAPIMPAPPENSSMAVLDINIVQMSPFRNIGGGLGQVSEQALGAITSYAVSLKAIGGALTRLVDELRFGTVRVLSSSGVLASAFASILCGVSDDLFPCCCSFGLVQGMMGATVDPAVQTLVCASPTEKQN